MKSIRLILMLLVFAGATANAQNGTIRGTVTDAETGESLPFVNVIITGTTTGTTTDLDGKFSLSTAPGTYSLQVSFISFTTKTIEGIVVEDGEVTLLENVALSSSMTQLQEVVVAGTMRRNNENALQTMKMKSATVLDGISASSFRKIGDSDAASSMKRVPGVSVQDGKYIFVRGLGDRYTKTMLNGMDIPGLDPDRNSLQMDIFPTSVLDNILVHKTFTADLPADFTGGVIDINTKDFPEEKTANISVGLAYNPNFHFNNDYLTYETGATDFLGFDDGTRENPISGSDIPQFVDAVGNPESETGQEYISNLASFEPNMGAFREMSLMDMSIGFDYGNQFKKGKYTMGYNFVLNYRNETTFYDDVQYSRYGLEADPNDYEQRVREDSKGELGINNVLVSALAGFSIKTTKSKFQINALRLQSGESKAGIFDYYNNDQGAEFEGFQHNLEYSQRSLSNVNISGVHNLAENKWEVTWKLSPTFSTLDDPDIRFTRYEERSNNNLVIGTEAGLPERIWRELREFSVASMAKATRNFNFMEHKAKFHFGGNHTFKSREFDIRNYIFQFPTSDPGFDLTGNPDELFAEENRWPINGDISKGVVYNVPWLDGAGNIQNPNNYESSSNNLAGFVSAELKPLPRLKAIIGLRTEYYTQKYTGTDQAGTISLDDSLVLDDISFFPTINLVFAVNDKQNIRVSGTKTIARPSFKEMSYAEIYDPLTSRTFVGGLFKDIDPATNEEVWDGNLTSSDIYNIDLRYELFPKMGRSYSIGGFYKYFENPIEIVQFAQQAGAFQPRNVGDGQVLGAELEIRQSLEPFVEKLKYFSAVFNFTYTYSRIELSETEYKSRVDNARTGQTIDKYRDMAGQAPYIVNAGISFDGKLIESGFAQNLEAGLYYNVQGPTLVYVGIVDRPDVYSEPFHSLNFNANKKFGEDNRITVGFKVSNLLADLKEEYSRAYEGEDKIFTRFNPGTTFSAKFGYRF